MNLPKINFKKATGKYLELNSGHITGDDNKTIIKGIQDPECPIIIYNYAEGYFIHLSQEKVLSKALKAYGFSNEFIYIYTEAAKNKFYFLRIDRDGFAHQNLPIFDW